MNEKKTNKMSVKFREVICDMVTVFKNTVFPKDNSTVLLMLEFIFEY